MLQIYIFWLQCSIKLTFGVDMEKLVVKLAEQKVGELYFEKSNNSFVFNYTAKTEQISLTMPYKPSSYIWANHLHPIFDMHMPEGYLLEIFRKYISKEHGYVDEFLLFSYLCANIQSKITYDSYYDISSFLPFDLEYVLSHDTKDTFDKLVQMFLSKNAISGVQPKTLAILGDKETLLTREYIVKTWGDEFDQLGLNEYFCLKAVQNTGVDIPNIQLSKNNKFLLVERFDIDKDSGEFLGFEEILGLMGKNKDEKYSGSYEAVANMIYDITTDKSVNMEKLYKIIVMNYLLKNGDAHLKNFGVLIDNSRQNIWLCPAYDIVCTTAYMPRDTPALTMFGRKVWLGKSELVRFGHEFCRISPEKSWQIYDNCFESLKASTKELQSYVSSNPNFAQIGKNMIDSWTSSIQNGGNI